MREIRTSGSEGGAGAVPLLPPILRLHICVHSWLMRSHKNSGVVWQEKRWTLLWGQLIMTR